MDKQLGAPDIVLYNASGRTRGAFAELDPIEVARELAVSAYGGFLVAQQAARRMLLVGRGAILLTGASASVKGYAQSAPFAMGKFALRGLAQSIARELAPKGIHQPPHPSSFDDIWMRDAAGQRQVRPMAPHAAGSPQPF